MRRTRPRGETVVVAGALAQRPGVAGHAWVFLQYLLAFRRAGFDVVFLDRLEPSMCTDAAGAPCPPAQSRQVAWLDAVLCRVGFRHRWSLRCDGSTVGLADREVRVALRSSVLVLDVMGHLADDLLAEAGHTAFLDIDPGFGQMWQANELATLFGRHDRYVTVGTNIGAPDCAIPTLGLDWITTRPLVALDHWSATAVPERGAFTTIATWRGPFAPVEHEGTTYGLRVHEFRAYADLPRRTGLAFRAAVDIDDSDREDRQRLRDGGWQLVAPSEVASDLDRYRSFIDESLAEIMIAKGMYVRSRAGWFSDRSACYLAAGRPVLMQDTGFNLTMPVDAGLVCFATPDEAAEHARAIAADARRHSAAARRIAEDVFASDVVLEELLRDLEVG